MPTSTNFLTLPDNFISSILDIVGNLFSTLSPIITLILGTLLAVFVIGAILSWIKH